VYPCSLYTGIPPTATVRTTRVYIPSLLLVEEGMNVLIRILCPLLHFSCVFSSRHPSLWNRRPQRLCRCLTLCLRLSPPLFPLPLAFLSVQDDISTLAAMFLSTAPSFTNVRPRAGRVSPNRSLTKAGVVCPKFPRTPQSVYRTGPRFHQDQENHELITGSLVAGFHFRPDIPSLAILTDGV
jgi:hypothetical protein